MPIVEAKCTNCGATLSVDSAKDAAICQYCSSAFIVEKAINNYRITNNNYINAEVVNIINAPSTSIDFSIKAGRLVKYQGASIDVIIPKEVTVIGSRAFADLDLIESVVIPKGVKLIESGAFADCLKLERISISDTVEKIDQGAFENCENLVSIDIPDSVLFIAPDAFAGCNKLRHVSYSRLIENRVAFRYTPIYVKLAGVEWQCQFCDTHNSADAKFCITCGIENICESRPRGVELKWKCPNCFYLNYPEDMRCASCFSERNLENLSPTESDEFII